MGCLRKKIPGSNIIQKGYHRAILENLNRQKYTKLRTPLKGFPVNKTFETAREIEGYFSGDRIQCLLCGRWRKSLAHHVSKVHEITSREYKIKYGLPLNRGLGARVLRNKQKNRAVAQMNRGDSALSKEEVRLKGCALARERNIKEQYVVQPFNFKRMSKTHKYSLLKRQLTPGNQ